MNQNTQTSGQNPDGRILPPVAQINTLEQSRNMALMLAESVPDLLFCGFKTYLSKKTNKIVKHPLSLVSNSVGREIPVDDLVRGYQVESATVPEATYWGAYMQSPVSVDDCVLYCLDLDYKNATGDIDPIIGNILKISKQENMLREKSHSGKGAHIFVLAPDDSTLPAKIVLSDGQEIEIFGHSSGAGKSVLLTGTDIRGELLTYGSMRQLLNDLGVDDALINPPKPTRTTPALTTAVGHTTAPKYDGGLNLDDLRDALDFLDSDGYDDWVAVGLSLYPLGNQGFAMWDKWSRKSDKYSPFEAEHKWESFRTTNSDPKNVFKLAQDMGWRNPKKGVRASEFVRVEQGNYDKTLLGNARGTAGSTNQNVNQNAELVHISEDNLPKSVVCKPFDFLSDIPPRRLIEINRCKYYAQGFLSVTGAAGGSGKSSLSIVEELSLAIGRDLFLPNRPALKCGRKRVWSMSLEDDETEHRRRVVAAMRYYNLTQQDIEGYFLVTYKADSPIEVGYVDRNVGFVASPQVDAIKATVRELGIDVINVDPFVNTHGVQENDNGAMNKVADLWRSVAQECMAAVGLTHHIRKSNASDIGVEDLRGAVSLTSAARLVRVLAPMSPDDAKRFGVEEERRRFYFWVNPSGKSNIAPPSHSRIWYHMASFDLDNAQDDWEADNIGVVEAWDAPTSMDGITGNHVSELARKMHRATDDFLTTHCRASSQAKGWIGKLVGEIVDIDCSDEDGKAKIKSILKEWVKSGVLKESKVRDSNRIERACFVLGSGAIFSSFEE